MRFTVAVQRGLQELHSLVHADVEEDQSNENSRWTKQQQKEVLRALDWMKHMAYHRLKGKK